MAIECVYDVFDSHWQASCAASVAVIRRVLGTAQHSPVWATSSQRANQTQSMVPRYGRPTIVVTESGCDVPDESQLDAETAVHDAFRVEFYRGYLAAAMQAKNVDGVRLEVRGVAYCGSASWRSLLRADRRRRRLSRSCMMSYVT